MYIKVDETDEVAEVFTKLHSSSVLIGCYLNYIIILLRRHYPDITRKKNRVASESVLH